MENNSIDLMRLVAAVFIMIFGGSIATYGLWTSSRHQSADAKIGYGIVAVISIIGTFILVGNLLMCFK